MLWSKSPVHPNQPVEDGVSPPSRRSRRFGGGAGSRGRGWLSAAAWLTNGSLGVSITILLGLPVYLAWDYGGILPWSQWVATAAILVLGVVCLPLLFQRGFEGQIRLLAIPLICLAIWALAWLQTAPLGESIVGRLSPGSAVAYTDWLPAQLRGQPAETVPADAAAITAGRFPISVCAHLTRAAQIGPALFAAVCLIAAVVFRSRTTTMLMLAAIALSGATISFLGISDQIRAPVAGVNASVITPDRSAAAPFGPFVCRNNAAGYLNLTLAAAIGLLVFSFRLAEDRVHGDLRFDLPPQAWWDRPVSFLQNLLLQIDTATIAALMLVILNIAGILASQSRGGALAVVSGTVAAVLLTGSRSARLWQPLGILLSVGGVAILLGSIGLIQRVGERLETLWSSGGPRDGRLDHWPDGLAAAWQYFPAGSGLGTYRFAYLPYQHSSPGAWFINADNMAVEWLVEGGIWLLPLVIAAVVFFAMCLMRLAQVHKAPHLTALVATGWFVIGSQMVSEFFDFGILLPSNYLTLAVLVGAVLGVSSRRYATPRRGRLEPSGGKPWFRIALLATFALTLFPLYSGIRVAHQNASDDYLIRETIRWGDQRRVDESLAEQIMRGSNNPELHMALAAQRIAGQIARGEQTLGRLDPQRSVDHAQAATLDARRAAYYLQAEPQPQDAASVLLPGQSIDEIRAARQHALIALILCPLNDAARFRLLQTGFAAEDSRQTVSSLLVQWGQLRCRFGDALDRAARLAAVYPGREVASPLIRQLLIAEPQRLASIWPVFELIGDQQTYSQLLPDDPLLLLRAVETQSMDQPLRQTLILRLRNLLAEMPAGEEEAHWAYLVGRLELIEHDHAQAAKWFERAIAADPSTTIYRFRLAESLEQSGQRAEAIKQIELCLLQEPQNSQYQAKRKQWLSADGLPSSSRTGQRDRR